MNKLFTKIAKLILGLAMAAGVGVAVSGAKTSLKSSLKTEAIDSADYDISTSALTSLTDETTVVWGCTYSSQSYRAKNTADSNWLRCSTSESDWAIFTITKIDNKFYLKTGTSYAYASAAKKMALDTSSKTAITLDTDGSVKADGIGVFAYNYNNGSGGIRAYASLGTMLKTYLYEVTEKATDNPTITPTKTSTTGYTGTYETISFTYSNLTTDTIGVVSGDTSKVTISDLSSSNGEGSVKFNFIAKTTSAVTVSFKDGGDNGTQLATCSVTVNESYVSITGLPSTEEVYLGEENLDLGSTITVTTYGSISNAVSWTSSNGSVATVDGDGEVTAVSTGTVTITVTSDSYSSATMSCSVTVKQIARYELITDASGLQSGSNYLIGAYASNTYRFMSTTQNSNNRGHHVLAGSVTNNKVAFEDGMEVVTLGGSSNNGWTLYAKNSETPGYLFLPSNNNYLRTRESAFTWGISFSDGVPSISATVTNKRYIKYNSSNNPPIFSCYTSGQTNISLWKELSTAETIAISKDSVTGMKGDSDNTVSITATNFNPTDIQVSYSTASIASITKGTISNGVIPLNISLIGVGDTTATITVKGGKADYSVDLDISVEAKPNILRIVNSRTANPLVDITSIEIQNGNSTGRSFDKTNIYVQDTDGNAIEIGTISEYVTLSRISGDDCVSISGGKITGTSVGTAVVKFELKSLSTVSDTITVVVKNNYLISVNSVTFGTGLTAYQGDSPTTDIFTERLGNYKWGSSTGEIPLQSFRFSYDNEVGVASTQFSYDFSHGTLSGDTHKVQTIYVYCILNEQSFSCGSYSVTVEQKDDPLAEIEISNVTNRAKSLDRGASFQLELTYTAESGEHNPTDGKEVLYSISSIDNGVILTVSNAGLISISNRSGLGSARIVVKSAHNESIGDYVDVTITLESMTYTVVEPESWTELTDPSTLKAGDKVLMTGIKDEKTVAMGTYTSGSNIKAVKDSPLTIVGTTVTDGVKDEMIYTIRDGVNSGQIAFEDSNGKYLYAASSTGNALQAQTDIDANASFDVDSSSNVIATNSSNRNRMRYNSNSTNDALFNCYANDNTGSVIKFYIKAGGNKEKNVDLALFNAIHNNFGDDATYTWDPSCDSFAADSWGTAGQNLTGISGFANYKLNIAQGDINGNEIEEFLAKYDIIIGKTSTNYDFLGRFSVGGINAGQKVTNGGLTLFGTQNTSTIAIIVIISMVSVTAIGGYFFLRKRREQN